MNNIKYSICSNPDCIPVIHSNWYPPIAVQEKNPQYAQLLMPDLASAASEMTTVHTYLYQSWTIGNDYETIRCVIKRLAAVEQHHYAIIGQLIALLGGEPGMPFHNEQLLLVRKYDKLQLRPSHPSFQ